MSLEEQKETRVVCAVGGRADRLVAALLGIGRRRAREWIEAGTVLVDGRRVRCGERLLPAASITVRQRVAPPGSPQVRVAGIPRIVWRCGHLIAVNKPTGYHSHRGKQQPSVADFLAEQVPGIDRVGNLGVECGLVHRLDRDTSGILVAVSDAAAYAELRAAFGSGEVSKDYLALVDGVVAASALIDVPLARLHTHVRAARRSDRSWPARTRIEPLEHGPHWTLVLATMETGVTHQIRAHLAIFGHPVIGDLKYGRSREADEPADGHLLHAFRIRLPGQLSLSAPPGGRFVETLSALRAGTSRGS